MEGCEVWRSDLIAVHPDDEIETALNSLVSSCPGVRLVGYCTRGDEVVFIVRGRDNQGAEEVALFSETGLLDGDDERRFLSRRNLSAAEADFALAFFLKTPNGDTVSPARTNYGEVDQWPSS
jgi:hypothetical protein